MIDNSSSIQVYEDVYEPIIANPDFPFLISFPRTGSHWLRMVMELYFEKPALVRIFYFKEMREFTCYHHHDTELSLIRQNVLYLYRHPIDTIYSQINYYKEDPFEIHRITYWTNLYARHLSKWLLEETFTTHKTLLTYDGMKIDPVHEFKKVCAHLGQSFKPEKLEKALRRVTKEEVKKKTNHDPQVINDAQYYASVKEVFIEQYGKMIMNILDEVNPRLKSFFKGKPSLS